MARLEAVTRNATDPSFLFSFAVIRSIVEEIVLRGVLVSLLTPFFSTGVIIALMCSLGAALHPFADTWVLMVILSAVLTTVRLYSRSVIPSMVLHVTHTVCLWLLWHRVVQ
jgi:membrane protease YdiL (CAAX protease family)